MKEYIFQLDNVAAGNDIVVANAPAGLTVKNILAIINKTTGNPVHSPIAEVIDAVTYSGTAMTITLDSNAPSVEGNLLIKAYTDEEEREKIMGGKMVTYEEDYLPAAQYGTDNTDYRPVLIGDMDYTISEDDAFGLANGVAVGTVFRVMEDNSGDEHDMMSVPKTVDETTLTVASYDNEPTIEGVTEWLNFEKDKCYIVTGVYEVADGEGDTWIVYTFEEYEPGRSGKEVYDKVDEVKEAIAQIDFSAIAKQGNNTNVSLTKLDAKLGAYVAADNTEYAAFKSHMQTEIANILTPITEEEE